MFISLGGCCVTVRASHVAIAAAPPSHLARDSYRFRDQSNRVLGSPAWLWDSQADCVRYLGTGGPSRAKTILGWLGRQTDPGGIPPDCRSLAPRCVEIANGELAA